jgi:hypothetical protein
MKIRNGFVSNSSTSSFIVKLWQSPLSSKSEKRVLSEEKEKLLFNYGFRYTFASAEHIEMNIYDHSWEHEEPKWAEKSAWREDAKEEEVEAPQMGYFVVCNEDWVYRFLIDNQIPFESVNHYGHYALWWDGEADFVVRACNFGTAYRFDVWRDGKFTDGFEQLLEGKSSYGDLSKPFEKIPLTYWTEDEMLAEELEYDDED